MTLVMMHISNEQKGRHASTTAYKLATDAQLTVAGNEFHTFCSQINADAQYCMFIKLIYGLNQSINQVYYLVWDEELTVRKFSALIYIKPWARVSRAFMWLVVCWICSVVESVLVRIQDSNVLKSWSLSESLSYRLINRQKFRRVTSIIFGVMVLTHAPTKLTSRPDRIISSVSVIIIQLSSTGT